MSKLEELFLAELEEIKEKRERIESRKEAAQDRLAKDAAILEDCGLELLDLEEEAGKVTARLDAYREDQAARKLVAEQYTEDMEGEELAKAYSFCKALEIEIEEAEEETEETPPDIPALTA